MLYFSFQKMEIYQLSKELVKDIYKLRSSFPSDEKYAFVLQINRAAASIFLQYLNNISTTFQPHFNHISTIFILYLNSVLYNINI